METLINNVEQWAHEKKIDEYKNWEKQFMATNIAFLIEMENTTCGIE